MNKDKRHILNIDATPVMIEKLPFHDRLPFWNQLLEAVHGIQEENLTNEYEIPKEKRRAEL